MLQGLLVYWPHRLEALAVRASHPPDLGSMLTYY